MVLMRKQTASDRWQYQHFTLALAHSYFQLAWLWLKTLSGTAGCLCFCKAQRNLKSIKANQLHNGSVTECGRLLLLLCYAALMFCCYH